ncbi:thioesterase family protein [Spongiibacter nanhainus]|uniref:Thioesterase family protein n=1 Tax=Spongiibacter nanhainus TaxID=2794344 RepID=A0A7T4QY73_9GAMM|nr:thioesterase family protein [Spongiibacter nanhainus]QQD16989.1 thioesterase family protein [Spongiibacter nanhainus]
MQTFSTILDSLQAIDDDHYNVSYDDSWLQGRTAFGGLSASLVVAAMAQTVPEDRALRALSVSFVGPATPGQHSIRLRRLREGGSVSHLQGELVCDGEVATSVSAAFGSGRSSSYLQSAPPRPDCKKPEECERLPFIQGLTPDFTQHFEMRLTHGALPGAKADSADYGLWLRFVEPTPTSIASLIALADVPPMPGLNVVQAMKAGSSLSWYLEFPAGLDGSDMNDWWYYDYRCQSAADGYFNNTATIWDPSGRPAMFSRQVAVVFEHS